MCDLRFVVPAGTSGTAAMRRFRLLPLQHTRKPLFLAAWWCCRTTWHCEYFVGNCRIRCLPQAIACGRGLNLSHVAAKKSTVYSSSVSLVLCTVILSTSICQSCKILFQCHRTSESHCASGNLVTKNSLVTSFHTLRVNVKAGSIHYSCILWCCLQHEFSQAWERTGEYPEAFLLSRN